MADEGLPVTVERVRTDESEARVRAIGADPPEHPDCPGFFASGVDVRWPLGGERDPFGPVAELTIRYRKPETWRDRPAMS